MFSEESSSSWVPFCFQQAEIQAAGHAALLFSNCLVKYSEHYSPLMIIGETQHKVAVFKIEQEAK